MFSAEIAFWAIFFRQMLALEYPVLYETLHTSTCAIDMLFGLVAASDYT